MNRITKYFVWGKMIDALRPLIVVFVIVFTSFGCQDQFEGNVKYQRPDWLVGKIYTQIEAQDNLSMFAQCMKEIGYDSIVDKSGAYAAFVPTDSAFQEYLNKKNYSTVSDIPNDEKMNLVTFHLVQMPWNKGQLQRLSARGWIDENDISNDKPYAFKRQTLYRNPNKSYPVIMEREGPLVIETIVPEEESNTRKIVYSNSRKYVPLFFDAYLSAVHMTGGDFSYFFNRPYEFGNVYYAGAKILGEEIYSDNGFIYKIDQIIEPLKNAEELMEHGFESYTYQSFKELINGLSEFQFNQEATYSQEGAAEGLEVDELFDLSYRGIEFDIHQELTSNPNSPDAHGQTMENHYGIVVPTDEAFQNFVDEVLTTSGSYRDIDQIPVNLKRMIINCHMSEAPIYEKEGEDGFFNAEGDFISIDESTIIQREFGSNVTFIGVNEMIVPKAFASVSGFLYLDPGYFTFLMGMQYVDLLGALKDEDSYFSLFAIPNSVLVKEESLIINWQTWRQDRYNVEAFSIGENKYIRPERKEISDNMFSLIGIQPLQGLAKKEFIETLSGKHIVIDNVQQTISGGRSSVFGYAGDSLITVNFKAVEGNFYNGEAYEIDGWLRFPSQELITRLYGTKFYDLLRKAGLATEFDLRFAHESERYTIFLPSDSALVAAQADTLTENDLKQFLLTHIIKDELIFTDGRKNEGSYRTMSRKEDGTGFHLLNIKPSVDIISILNEDGNVIIDIPEDESKTNRIAVKDQNNVISTSAVVHIIDSVIPLVN